MDNRGEAEEVFEYTGDGCSVPKDVISVRVKEGVQKIRGGAFFNCELLKRITLPSTLVEIGERAFYGCGNLREVIFNEGLQKIGEYAFLHCELLKRITLPSTVTEIGYRAFSGCSNLREITFNDGLQKIGKYAFSCTSLESITLPSTLVEIGDDAFCGCRNLREVTFNDGLQKIGEGAFLSCTSLESIALPSTVTEIGQYAFSGCSNLREVELNGNPIVKSEAFHNCEALEIILFPNISYRLENIIQTSHWVELEDKVNEVRGVVQWESNKLLFLSGGALPYWNETKRNIGRITRLVSYYELKHATVTIELALWKFKLDQSDATNTTNRAAYRIDVPGPVKDTMLEYLD